MPKSPEQLQETETIILWNATGEPAVLYTADTKVRKEWVSFGFPVREVAGGWRVEVPVDRITYKPLKVK
jgi:hypothetical protein